MINFSVRTRRSAAAPGAAAEAVDLQQFVARPNQSFDDLLVQFSGAANKRLKGIKINDAVRLLNQARQLGNGVQDFGEPPDLRAAHEVTDP